VLKKTSEYEIVDKSGKKIKVYETIDGLGRKGIVTEKDIGICKGIGFVIPLILAVLSFAFGGVLGLIIFGILYFVYIAASSAAEKSPLDN